MLEQNKLEQLLNLRNRFARRINGACSAEQRIERFAKLQQASFDVLLASPNGYHNFLRRNLHSRRVEVVDGEYQPVSSDRHAQQP